MKLYNKTIYGMLLLFGILHLLDLIFTFKGISLFGYWIESNDYVRNLFIKGVSFIWILLKVFGLILYFLAIRFILKLLELIKIKEVVLFVNICLTLSLSYNLISIFITCFNWVLFFLGQ
jgi:hypothetical protein